jgi:pectin methylesterase-like acyl-CoA thioesterase
MTTPTQQAGSAKLQSSAILKEAAARAKETAANTVKVWPGGATFTTIMDAMNSIQNASPALQYQVVIGPGTYTETVWLKDNVFLSGSGQDQTILTNIGNGVASGVLISQGNCGAGMMSVICTGGAANTYSCALYFAIDGTFTGSGLTLTATDSGNAENRVTCVSNMAGSNSVDVILSNCTINATSVNGTSACVGVQLMASTTSLDIQMSTVTGGGAGGVGIMTSAGTIATVEDCTVTGLNWSLDNSDNQSPITATGCTLNGPTSAGVIVKP